MECSVPGGFYLHCVSADFDTQGVLPCDAEFKVQAGVDADSCNGFVPHAKDVTVVTEDALFAVPLTANLVYVCVCVCACRVCDMLELCGYKLSSSDNKEKHEVGIRSVRIRGVASFQGVWTHTRGSILYISKAPTVQIGLQ